MQASTALAGGTLRQRWQRRDPLLIGLAVSLTLHVAVLAARFSPPKPIRFEPMQSQLDVVLLNTHNRERPEAPDVLAQVDNTGGGDRDEGRARSPLPPDALNRDGDELQRTAERVKSLEAEQQRLMTLSRSADNVAQASETGEREPEQDAVEADESAEQISRMQAQIDKQIEDYNKRPRRLTYGINARSVAFAHYVESWTERIERIGTGRFLHDLKGGTYDSLIVTVEVDRYGNVRDVLINRKSKFDALNDIIKKIVLAGAPYDPFTPDMVREGDILQIVRTWTFTSDQLKTGVVRR